MLICLATGGGRDDLDTVVTRYRAAFPAAELFSVWCGDPQLRPVAPTGAPWGDLGLPDPSGIGWGRWIVACRPAIYLWMRTLRVVQRHLAAEVVLAVDADRTVPVGGALDRPLGAVAAIARRRGDAPSARPASDLAAQGRYSMAALLVESADAAGRLAAELETGHPDAPVGPLWSAALDVVGVVDLTSGHAVGWHADRGDAAIVDESVDADPDDAATSCLPGGVRIDDTIRAVTADAIAAWRRSGAELPPDPYEDTARYFAWLECAGQSWGPDTGRYWQQLWARRADVQTLFPAPDGAARQPFDDWARNRWRFDGQSPLLRPDPGQLRPPWTIGDDRRGCNVVGFVASDNSTGDVARRIIGCLDAADVPRAALHYARTDSPGTTDDVGAGRAAPYSTSVVVVNADQTGRLQADHPALFGAGRHNVAYWFWELEQIPDMWVEAARSFDEIWVATEYSAEAFRRVVEVPVRVVEVPLLDPQRSDRDRASFGMERFTFLVTFDHLSVTERKNPIGAIEAFRSAFPLERESGPILLVKTVNGAHRPIQHDALHRAAAGRPDICIVDEHLDRADQMALIGGADVLVSLHRAEGLGLHLIEAMWLGTPVVTTRYSGNMQFTTDDNAALVDATMVPVARGEGYLPEGAMWADPDLDQAADWMCRLADEAAELERLRAGGRSWVISQPSFAEAGARMRQLLTLGDAS